MSKVASQPPTLWKIPDIAVVLLLPIAVLFILIDAIVLRGNIFSQATPCPHTQQ